MPIITKVSVQKNNTDRANIFIDGKYKLSLSLDEVLLKGLAKGHELESHELDNLIKQSETEKIYAKVLNFLSYRPRSKKEIELRLYKYFKSKPDAQVTSYIIDKLVEKNLINDLDFANWFIDQRISHRPRSKRALFSELRSKGIDSSTITQAISESTYSESEEITKLVDKYKTRKSLQKLKEFLLRKGFRYSDIIKVLENN